MCRFAKHNDKVCILKLFLHIKATLFIRTGISHMQSLISHFPITPVNGNAHATLPAQGLLK